MTGNKLERFIKAQESTYGSALKEIRNGRKTSHWMWFIFPQIQGLGNSDTAKFYAITSLSEAKAYLNDPVLGPRLTEICTELLRLSTDNPVSVFGDIDSIKLKSSMTLFSSLENTNDVFQRVLDKFYSGAKDERTLQIINTQ